MATRLADGDAALHHLQSVADGERVRAATADASLAAARVAAQDLEQRLQAGRLEIERLVAEREALAAQLHHAQGDVLTLRRVAEERENAQAQARVQLKAEFEVLANRLFEDKGKAMLGEGRAQLDAVLLPLRDRLTLFQQQIQSVHETDIRERSSLKSELASLLKAQATLGEEAQRLSRALTSDKQAQGSWGELTLQRLLEASNLQRGLDYELQVHARDDEGAPGRPDAVIYLPEDKALVVDAKVSLKAFVAACSATTTEERERHLAAHAASVRAHMRGLAAQRYPELLGTRTLDLTILFLPSEPGFAAAMAQDDSLWLDAFAAKVVVVSPTTLLATLRVAAQVWQMERQNRHAATVFAEATKIIDKFAAFVEDLDAVGRNLTAAQRSWDEARGKLVSGKGNLVSRIGKLHRLGASNVKAKTAAFLAEHGPDQTDDGGEAEREADDDAGTEATAG
jgi:DNA recombination protein RmuC